MRALLDGTPQFIIASINFLITSSQAIYVLKLEDVIKERLKANKDITRHKTNWSFLLLAWWILTGTAIFTFAARIVPSIFLKNDNSYFIVCDPFIIFGTFVGYCTLAVVAARSWKWSSWQGRMERKTHLDY